MALIGTIRKNSWLLVVMIALGLGGFLIMDITNVGGVGGQTQFNVGEVDGEPIDWIDFQKAQDAMYTNSQIDVFEQRSYVWDYMIEDKIVTNESEALGISVGEDEMQELVYGTNLSPVVRRNFSDPNTGQLNFQSLNEFRQAADAGTLAPQFQRIWDWQFEEVKKTRLQTKILALVKKGIYTPTWMAEDIQNDVGSSIDFKYALVPFDQLDDTEVEVSEEDYEAYINENAPLFERETETRDAIFVTFDVLPTSQDTMLMLEKFTELSDQFLATDEDSIFALNNYGSYNSIYLTQDQLPAEFGDSIWALEAGTIYGPFVDPTSGTYNSVKSLGKKMIPDSVRSRHILIGATTQEQAPIAVMTADTVLQKLRDGSATFEELSDQYSTDQVSKAKGGDLGYAWPGQFVQPMNDHLFYGDAEPGEYKRVATQFGLHIVEVLDRKYVTDKEGIRVATIAEPIIPSDETQDDLYDDVLEFAGQNRTVEALNEALAADPDLSKINARALSANDFNIQDLGQGQSSRSIIRWMFDGDTKKGQVAPEVFIYEDAINYFNSKYVVVGLEEINKAGLPKVEQVVDDINAPVTNKKKADKLAAQMSGKTISQVASEFSQASVDTVVNVNFGSQIMRNIGDEPKVLGTAVVMEVGDVSQPIIGESGVFVIELIKKTPAGAAQNYAGLRQQGSMRIANAADRELLSALRKKAEISDLRSNFY